MALSSDSATFGTRMAPSFVPVEALEPACGLACRSLTCPENWEIYATATCECACRRAPPHNRSTSAPLTNRLCARLVI